MIKKWTKARQEKLRRTMLAGNVKEIGQAANELAVEIRRLNKKLAEHKTEEARATGPFHSVSTLFGPEATANIKKEFRKGRLKDEYAHMGIDEFTVMEYTKAVRRTAYLQKKIQQKKRSAYKSDGLFKEKEN